MYGGDYSSSDTLAHYRTAFDTREAVKMYSYMCDTWYDVLATEIKGKWSRGCLLYNHALLATDQRYS